MNKEALLKLAEILESKDVLEENFDLTAWMNDKNKVLGIGATFGEDSPAFQAIVRTLKTRFRNDRRMEVPHNCGMTCCACGWAGLNRWFISRGFKTTHTGNVSYRGMLGWDAVTEFFGLDNDDAEYLFSDTSYDEGGVSKLEVAARIREFVS